MYRQMIGEFLEDVATEHSVSPIKVTQFLSSSSSSRMKYHHHYHHHHASVSLKVGNDGWTDYTSIHQPNEGSHNNRSIHPNNDDDDSAKVSITNASRCAREEKRQVKRDIIMNFQLAREKHTTIVRSSSFMNVGGSRQANRIVAILAMRRIKILEIKQQALQVTITSLKELLHQYCGKQQKQSTLQHLEGSTANVNYHIGAPTTAGSLKERIQNAIREILDHQEFSEIRAKTASGMMRGRTNHMLDEQLIQELNRRIMKVDLKQVDDQDEQLFEELNRLILYKQSKNIQ